MEDHGLVNALPESRSRFAFLLDEAPSEARLRSIPEPATPGQGLAQLVGYLTLHGLRPLVVDHGMSTLHALDLRAAKVIVPGLLPMTFGHLRRRVGLPRLQASLSPDALEGVLPHPFM